MEEMNKQREENGACSSYPESRKNSNEVQMKYKNIQPHFVVGCSSLECAASALTCRSVRSPYNWWSSVPSERL